MGASAEPAWLFAACASPSGASAGPGAARPESLSRKGLQTKKKIPGPTFSENVPEAMSAFRVWLEPEPRAHVSAGRQQALPCI